MRPTADDAKVDIGVEVDALLQAWADRRLYDPLCCLWGGYRSINGLTDGWEIFLDSLKRLRGMARMQETEYITSSEAETIAKLIGVVSRRLNDC